MVPNTHNTVETISKKQRQYCKLQQEKNKWMLEVKDVKVVSTIGVILTYLHECIKLMKLESTSFILMLKAVILNTTIIVQKCAKFKQLYQKFYWNLCKLYQFAHDN